MEYAVVIQEKGSDKLIDKLKDIRIEAISAKETIEKIATPNAATKIDSQLENLSKNADNIIASTLKVKRNYFAVSDELFKSFSGYDKNLADRFTKLSTQSSKMTLTMEQIQGLNEKAYKTLTQTSAAKLTANQAEIDALAKNAKSVEQVMTVYEKKKQLLEEQAEIEKARIASEYEEAKKAGGDIVALEKLKADNIALIDKKLKEDLKQNAKSYEASAKSLNDKLYKSLTENVEVAASTVSRKTKKIINDISAQTAKELGITEKDLEKVSQAAIDAQDKNKKAAAEAKKASESAGNATTAAKATGEAAAKTAEATKVIIDVEATREKVKMSIEALNHQRLSLEQNGKAIIAQYDVEIKASENDHERKKELEAKKAAAIKFYGEQIIQVRQDITAQEKKEQDLDLIQWQQYAEKLNGITNSIKDVTGKTADYLGSAFTAVSNVYKAEIAAMDEDLLHLKNKNAEFTQDYKNQQAELAAAKEETTARQSEIERKVAEEFSNYSQSQIDEEVKKRKEKDETTKRLKDNEREKQKVLDESLAKKQEIEAKERDLQAKKAKKQAEQEKIEKLNRKATLLKNIGEATANIAQGVTKALSYGPILGPILAAVVGVAGAVQIGIMTKQLAKFADGGLLSGKRHAQGGMRIEGSNIEVEGGEYVVNRESTNKNLGLVRYINSQRRELSASDMTSFFAKASQGYKPPFSRQFEAGGQMPAIASTVNADNEALVDAIKSIKFAPRVSVTDILRVQDEMTQIDRWSGV